MRQTGETLPAAINRPPPGDQAAREAMRYDAATALSIDTTLPTEMTGPLKGRAIEGTGD